MFWLPQDAPKTVLDSRPSGDRAAVSRCPCKSYGCEFLSFEVVQAHVATCQVHGHGTPFELSVAQGNASKRVLKASAPAPDDSKEVLAFWKAQLGNHGAVCRKPKCSAETTCLFPKTSTARRRALQGALWTLLRLSLRGLEQFRVLLSCLGASGEERRATPGLGEEQHDLSVDICSCILYLFA